MREIERESVPLAHDEVIRIAEHEVHIRKLPLFVSRICGAQKCTLPLAAAFASLLNPNS